MNPLHLDFTHHLFPALAAIPFILAMSLVREPARREFNAIFVAGASAAYLGGGLGLWELPYIVVAGCIVSYRGLRDYRWIGVAWLMHSSWDLVHHFNASPIWAWEPTSSWGCFIWDAVVGVWFLAGAPSVFATNMSSAESTHA